MPRSNTASRKSKPPLMQKLIALSLILYSTDFLGRQNILGVLLVVEMFFYIMVILRGRITMPKNAQFLPLFLFGFLYSLMMVVSDPDDWWVTVLYYLVFPCTLYLIGLLVFDSVGDSDSVVKVLLLFFGGFFLVELVNIVYSWHIGLFSRSTEYVLSFWTGRHHARTLSGMYMTPAALISMACLLHGRQNFSKWSKILQGGCLVSGVLLTAYLGNRTMILLILLVLVLEMLRSRKNKTWFRSFFAIILIGIILAVLYAYDIFGLRSMLGETYFFSRIQNGALLKSGRWSVYKDWINNLGPYFWGKGLRHTLGIELSYAHNIWIDTYLNVGFFPFLMLVWYTLGLLKNYFITRRHADDFERSLYFILVVGILINWGLEPVLEADPYYFSCCCGAFALLEGRLRMMRKKENQV